MGAGHYFLDPNNDLPPVISLIILVLGGINFYVGMSLKSFHRLEFARLFSYWLLLLPLLGWIIMAFGQMAIAEYKKVKVASGQMVINEYKKTTIGAIGQDPVCPNCGTVYNRGPVIRELKKKDPLIFNFAMWTTKFKCVKCGEIISISGSHEES